MKILVLFEDSLHLAFQFDNLHIKTSPQVAARCTRSVSCTAACSHLIGPLSKASHSLVLQREFGQIEECGAQLACPWRFVLTQL